MIGMVRTEQQCPEVWEGQLEDGRPIEVRERHRRVRILIGHDAKEAALFHNETAENVVRQLECGNLNWILA